MLLADLAAARGALVSVEAHEGATAGAGAVASLEAADWLAVARWKNAAIGTGPAA